MSNNSKIDFVVEQLYPKLKDYILSMGVSVDSRGFFSCINPNHPDKNPSACLASSDKTKDGRVFNCLSCGTKGNIFHATNILEKKPLNGVGFYQDTLVYLCKKFGVEYSPDELSEDEKREYQKRRAYSDAVEICHKYVFAENGTLREHPGIKFLLDRGITEETIKKFKIGVIPSYKEYINSMKSAGWEDENWLKGADLARNDLFNPQGVIIPIFNDKDLPVGFVTRTTKMTANEHGTNKYINSLNSDIYKKSEILFNFNRFNKKHPNLTIVEGYIDAIILEQNGYKNATAIGATVLTDQHVDMLMNYGVQNLIICLDGDDAGVKGTKLAIERLSPFKTFKIKVIDLPQDQDPDTFVREKGITAFEELVSSDRCYSSFAWTLKKSSFEEDPLDIAKRAIPSIAVEESSITRLGMIRELSRITGIAENEIRSDVDNIINKESSEYIKELSNLGNFLQVQLQRRKTQDIKQLLIESVSKVNNIEQRYHKKIDPQSNSVERITEYMEKIETGSFKYGQFAPRFSRYEKLFDGIPFTYSLHLFGGRPSSAKTCSLTSLGIDLINGNDDSAVFYMSIDDTLEILSLRMLAMKSGLSTTQIKNIINLNKSQKEKYDEAKEWLKEISERFIIADATLGNNVDTLDNHINYFVKKFPNHKKTLILDNFHKLRGTSGEKKDKVSDASERVKDVAQLNNMNVMMTVELRKLAPGAKPTNDDLKDTAQLEYDADAITLVHNELQVNPDTNIKWMEQVDQGVIPAPYIELNVTKNKVTGKTGRCCYRLSKVNMKMVEVDESEVVALENKTKLKNQNQIKF